MLAPGNASSVPGLSRRGRWLLETGPCSKANRFNYRPQSVMATQQHSPPAPVSKDDLWSALLTTMPGVNSKSWTGRVGEWVTFTGSSTSTSTSHGSLLHLWRQQGPEAVAVSYYQAQGLGPGTVSSGPAQRAGEGGGEGCGSSFVWDQAELASSATSFVFTPAAPQLQLTLPAASPDLEPPLHRSVRLLPLDAGGVAIVSGGLPTQGFSADLMAGQPPGSYWFVEVVLWHRDPGGEMCSSTVGLAYDWASGTLTSHRYYWQKETQVELLPATTKDSAAAGAAASNGGPAGSLAGPLELARLRVGRVTAPGVPPHRVATYKELLAGLPATATGTRLRYTYSEGARLLHREQGQADPPSLETRAGVAELWYPTGGAFARVPVDLQQCLAGAHAPLVLEVGALCGAGPGFTRVRLEFNVGGDCTVASVCHETFNP